MRTTRSVGVGTLMVLAGIAACSSSDEDTAQDGGTDAGMDVVATDVGAADLPDAADIPDADADATPGPGCEICASGAACQLDAGAPSCACPVGFVGDGKAAGTGCTDIDECATGANECDGFACVNTPGAFRCEGLYAVEPYHGVLARLNPKTFALLDLVPLTSTGAVSGVTAMVRHPQTSTIYVTAKVNGVAGRAFGMLDFSTGAIAVIAPVDRFSSLAFLPDGTLFGATGWGATNKQQLFTFDLAAGTPTQVGVLPTGTDGHVICYDRDAALMVRFRRNAMESFAPVAPLSTTAISTTLANEVMGCRYVGNHMFLVHDIQSHVQLVTAAGVVTAVPDAVSELFQDVRATEIATMTVPHSSRPRVGEAAGGTTITLRGRGLTGATSVAFGAVQAASFTVVDDTTITAVTPASAAGVVDVVVRTALPFPATWPAAYTFQ